MAFYIIRIGIALQKALGPRSAEAKKDNESGQFNLYADEGVMRVTSVVLNE